MTAYPFAVIILLNLTFSVTAFSQKYFYSNGTDKMELTLSLISFNFAYQDSISDNFSNGTYRRNGDTLYFTSKHYTKSDFEFYAGSVSEMKGIDINIRNKYGMTMDFVPVIIYDGGKGIPLNLAKGKLRMEDQYIDSINVYGITFQIHKHYDNSFSIKTPYSETHGSTFIVKNEKFICNDRDHTIYPYDQKRFGNIFMTKQ